MEEKITLESFTTKHIMMLLNKEFSHLLSKEDQNDITDIYIILSQIYKRLYEIKDPLYFHLNLIYEGLVGIDNTNLLRKYGIAILQDDFPIEDTQITYLHNFFLNCYICAIKVALISNKTSDESIISTMFVQLINEEKDRIGISEVVDNVYSLCQMISCDIGINNASIFILILLNPLNAYYFQESLIKDIDNEVIMTQSVKEFLKYLMPPKDFEELEDLIINVNCFSNFCKKQYSNAYDVFNYLKETSVLDDFQIKIIYFHTIREMNADKRDANIQNDMIELINNINIQKKIEVEEEKELKQEEEEEKINNKEKNGSMYEPK